MTSSHGSAPSPVTFSAVSDVGEVEGGTTSVLVRFFASARAAAGVEEEELRLPAGATVTDAVVALRERHPESLPRILEAAGFLLDGIAVRDTGRALPDGAELDVLPPFAGG